MKRILIVVGSVYGSTIQMANYISRKLDKYGYEAEVTESSSLENVKKSNLLLIMTATTGQGDIPQNITPFVDEIKESQEDLNDINYAIISFGDSGYGPTFCNSGRTIQSILENRNGNCVIPPFEIDTVEYLDPEEPINIWCENYIDKL
ncbi:flavodoxin domain-containing protein [Photobacterium halotolerans]|uniref:Flavodoxin-like domain-containing protein n=1 Tax=Photobacterium halotolerans TaxID=265726 RepID=A0A0F5VCN3_9GAMM|nr:flavodoxin domain-containing protein [Photobacterium halotolerans]KKC99239.1 hypothetical protein KY46_14190 [Photobacterium halotolerans]